LKAAYDDLPPTGAGIEPLLTNKRPATIDPKIKLLAKSLKEADAEAYRAHMEAEDTFERAEKRLSTSLAREGSRKAIISWEVREQAILKSKSAIRVG
jgi:hypothetical protein